jgi:hypothetical protein
LKNRGARDGMFYFRKGQWLKQKKKDLLVDTFELPWTAV